MLNYLRTLVSENRNRFIDDAVNLDLSYITDRIIAMSYPSEGFEGLYRNTLTEVKKFLDCRHADHYKVYNLRSEKQYTLSKFSKAANYPFLDHQAPPFTVLIQFCKDASEWLEEHPENIVAIHCKAGKGRTGTVIAALLLHLGICSTFSEAIRLYGEKRTKDFKGITIPSQVRYVEYYDFMLKHREPYIEKTKGGELVLQLVQIMIHTLPISLRGQEEFRLCIFDSDEHCIFEKKSLEMSIKRTTDTILLDNLELQLQGDFCVAILKKNGKKLFAAWLNTFFVNLKDDNVVRLRKEDVDLAYKDKECTEFSETFAVALTFMEEH